MPSGLPERPWQQLAVELFDLIKRHYLLVTNYYSRWIEVKPLESAKLRDTFGTHGVPDLIHSDNGPQFIASEYRDFANSFWFETVTSSPHFP